jgi:murein DD-endopeptidase MepM/ murein hydrolase activator NlpD
MAKRQWTILVVPPGSEGTRTYHLSERMRRYALTAVIAAGALVVSSVATLFSPWATPAARRLASENERLRGQLSQIDVRLAALDDTLASLGQRDQQIRLMAGLSADTAVATRPTNPERAVEVTAALGGLKQPFLGRLGFGSRPDIDALIRRASELSASFHAVSDTLTRNFERMANTPSIMPTTGWLSSQFSLSRFHPILHDSRAHEGIDLQAPMGAPIIAPAAGRVKSVGREPGFGNTFEIDHGNGIVTRFAHCSRIVVRVGQTVTRGQVMATVGNTGLATGPHLHYEVHVNGKAVNPLRFVLPDKIAD